jgi:hypothetical protein
LRVDGEEQGGARNECDRRKILLRIVFDLLGHDRLDYESRACKQQRVAIGRRCRGGLGADRRPAAGLVIDDDRLAKRGLQLLRQQPRQDVVRRTWRVGNDDPDGFARKGLSRRRLADRRKRCNGHDECELSSRGSAHALRSMENISGVLAQRSSARPPTQVAPQL